MDELAVNDEEARTLQMAGAYETQMRRRRTDEVQCGTD